MFVPYAQCQEDHGHGQQHPGENKATSIRTGSSLMFSRPKLQKTQFHEGQAAG